MEIEMPRSLISSDYADATVAWLDWFVTVALLLTGVGMVLTGNMLIGTLAVLGGLGSGFFITVTELGMLGESASV
jgi:ABC-type bacteriocin/lantibiotic exporter with double-glycine peptidase domain